MTIFLLFFSFFFFFLTRNPPDFTKKKRNSALYVLYGVKIRWAIFCKTKTYQKMESIYFHPHVYSFIQNLIRTVLVVVNRYNNPLTHNPGEILRSREDELLRKHSARMSSLIKNESVGIEDDQIPS